MPVQPSANAKSVQGPDDAPGRPVPMVPIDANGNAGTVQNGGLGVNVLANGSPIDATPVTAVNPFQRMDNGAAGWGNVSRMDFNGSTYDRHRSAATQTILSSSSRTTTQTGSDLSFFNLDGAILHVNVTLAGTGSITPSIQVKDPVSGQYKTVWTAAAAITANGLFSYLFWPGAANVASWTESIQTRFGATARVVIAANNANPVTYSVGLEQLGS